MCSLSGPSSSSRSSVHGLLPFPLPRSLSRTHSFSHSFATPCPVMRTHALALAILLSGSLSDAAKISFTQRKRPNNSSALQKRSGKAPFKRPVLAATSGADDSDVDLRLQSEAPNTLCNWIPAPPTSGSKGLLILYHKVLKRITVPNQAFVDASDVSNPILGYGVDGIVGLGFTKLSSVDSTLQKAGKTDGKSLLYNLFADNPKQPNFIAFALQRTTDGGGDVEGSFTIGEYDDDYKDVANSPKIPTFPETDPTRWSVLLDALLVGSKAVPLSSVVSGAPSGKAVVMFDSGTSYTYAPEDVCNAIYSGIDGASFNSGLQQWVVPCDAEVDIALQFGSNVYPIHPLDVTPANLADSTMCVGSFVPQTVSVAGGQFDWLIGDNVMRSVYTVYDFGDFDSSGNMGNPFMQLLALVDPNQASQEFHKARGGTPSGNITYNAQNVSSSTGAASSSPSSSGSSVTLSAELADTLNKLQGYFPAMLAVMALNALVLLVLAGAAITYLCRRRGKARARRNPGRASPLPLQRTSSFGGMGLAMGGGDNGEPHVYQPVSMALTEDTFVPPSPAFSKPGFGDNLRPGDRPNLPRALLLPVYPVPLHRTVHRREPLRAPERLLLELGHALRPVLPVLDEEAPRGLAHLDPHALLRAERLALLRLLRHELVDDLHDALRGLVHVEDAVLGEAPAPALRAVLFRRLRRVVEQAGEPEPLHDAQALAHRLGPLRLERGAEEGRGRRRIGRDVTPLRAFLEMRRAVFSGRARLGDRLVREVLAAIAGHELERAHGGVPVLPAPARDENEGEGGEARADAPVAAVRDLALDHPFYGLQRALGLGDGAHRAERAVRIQHVVHVAAVEDLGLRLHDLLYEVYAEAGLLRHLAEPEHVLEEVGGELDARGRGGLAGLREADVVSEDVKGHDVVRRAAHGKAADERVDRDGIRYDVVPTFHTFRQVPPDETSIRSSTFAHALRFLLVRALSAADARQEQRGIRLGIGCERPLFVHAVPDVEHALVVASSREDANVSINGGY
ncbi:hypothetical protein ACG7TL_003930 [Trametes sanguinea]